MRGASYPEQPSCGQCVHWRRLRRRACVIGHCDILGEGSYTNQKSSCDAHEPRTNSPPVYADGDESSLWADQCLAFGLDCEGQAQITQNAKDRELLLQIAETMRALRHAWRKSLC